MVKQQEDSLKPNCLLQDWCIRLYVTFINKGLIFVAGTSAFIPRERILLNAHDHLSVFLRVANPNSLRMGWKMNISYYFTVLNHRNIQRGRSDGNEVLSFQFHVWLFYLEYSWIFVNIRELLFGIYKPIWIRELSLVYSED